MESGGGNIRDRGAHVMSIILWCLNSDEQTPVTIEATGDPRPKGIWDCPPRMKVVYTFKNPDWELIWEQPGDVQGGGGFGMVFYGDKDKLVVSRDGTHIPANEKARNFKVPAGGVEVYRMAKYADYNMNHKEDWLQAISSSKKPCMDIEIAHRVANMCNVGNLSYILAQTHLGRRQRTIRRRRGGQSNVQPAAARAVSVLGLWDRKAAVVALLPVAALPKPPIVTSLRGPSALPLPHMHAAPRPA